MEEKKWKALDFEQDGRPSSVVHNQSTKTKQLRRYDKRSDNDSSSSSSASIGWFFDDEKVEERKDLNERELTKDSKCLPPTKPIEDIGQKVRSRLVEIKNNRREVRRIDTSTIIAENLLLEKQSLSVRNGVSAEGDDPHRRNERLSRGILLNPVTKKKAASTRKRRRSAEKYHMEKDEKDTIIVDSWTPDVSHLASINSRTQDENDKPIEEILTHEFSNTVQLHGLPLTTTSFHVRRLFAGLEPLKVMILPNNPVKIFELDSNHYFNEEEYDAEYDDDHKPKLERCSAHTRIFVEFDSPFTTSLALQRSGEYIQITKETEKQISKTMRLVGKRLNESSSKQSHIPVRRDNDAYERKSSVLENGKIIDEGSQQPDQTSEGVQNNLKSGLELISGCLLPSSATQTFRVAAVFTPLFQKTYETLSKNLFIPVDGSMNAPIIEDFLRELEMKIDPIIPSILWTASIYELQMTTSTISSHKSARNVIQNDSDDDSTHGQTEQSPSMHFPLYGKSNTCRIGRNMMKTSEEYDQLERHCEFIQNTVTSIQAKNPNVLLVGLDPTIVHKDPVVCLSARAIQCLKTAEDIIHQILLMAKRVHIQYFNNHRERIKSLFSTFRFVRVDDSTTTNRDDIFI
jgi:hypothetical protein